ncbi:MAG: DNA alkylation repair protein [Acholeplasmataceae bacterium]|nr:DNA alkylation repair protein [Acholeplasmataceae bacterium]
MEIIERIKLDVNQLKIKRTNMYRAIAKTYKKEMKPLDIQSIYQICESLLELNKTATTIIAYQIIYDQKDKYDEDTFDVFETWMYKYISDWWDCDDFMTHAFKHVLLMFPNKIKRIKKWINHERFAVRRSSAVILIMPSKKRLIDKSIIFEVCDLLMNDEHYLVQKGYGWLLKEASIKYHDDVIDYLEKNVSHMSRTAFRYALEKLPLNEKEKLMQIKV